MLFRSDNQNVTNKDLSSQYYCNKSDIGKNRAEVSLNNLCELNMYVDVKTSQNELNELFLKKFSIVVLTELDLEENEFKEWEKDMMNKHKDNFWLKNIYWKLSIFSCILIKSNKLWFEKAVNILKDIYDIQRRLDSICLEDVVRVAEYVFVDDFKVDVSLGRLK